MSALTWMLPAALCPPALGALLWCWRRLNARCRTLQGALDESQALLQALPAAVISTDADGQVRYLNPHAARLAGLDSRSAIGQPLADLLGLHHGGTAIDLAQQIRDCRHSGVGERRDAALGARGGRTDVQYHCLPLDRPGQSGALLLLHDVSERRHAEARLEFLAHHDPLTGLPNRAQLQIQLEHGIAYARRHGTLLAVLFADIDRFKSINDSLGHDAGDQVLSQFAQRLQQCVREVDTVARQGGDEFIVLLTELRSAQDAARVADKIVAALAAPFEVGGQLLAVGASVGIALYPDDDLDQDALVDKADLAMYAAKQRGRGASLRYAPSMQAQACSRLVLETALRHALEHHEFMLHYQPRLDLPRQRICGAKALIRWRHPELGLVMPLDFVPILEASALILPVGAWVLATAVAQAQHWLALGHPLTVSVNLSARQFYQKDIVPSLADLLQRHGVPGHCLELEITEGMLIDKNQNCEIILQQFKQLGVRIAIRDFGTGYASLNYLRRFPVDVVKIDKCFIDDLRRGGAEQGAVVRAIIGLAHTLNMKVIASGVETQEQMGLLAEMGCDEAFGFCLSRPVLPEQMDALLAQRSWSTSTERAGRVSVSPSA